MQLVLVYWVNGMGKISGNTGRVLTGTELQKMHRIQLDLLMEIHRICEAYSISYILEGGTLLGAVRHSGPIPWDDDADVSMLREDYERFCAIAPRELPEWCFLQTHDSDAGYRWGYGKLLDTRTRYVRVGQEHMHMRQCVWVDIFPFDGVPQNSLVFTLHDAFCYCLRKTLWSEVGRLHGENWLIRQWYFLLSRVPKRRIFGLLALLEKQWPANKADRLRCLCFPLPKRGAAFEKRWFVELGSVSYCGKYFPAPEDLDGFLKHLFGNDYLTYPPEEQQVGGSPGVYIRL